MSEGSIVRRSLAKKRGLKATKMLALESYEGGGGGKGKSCEKTIYEKIKTNCSSYKNDILLGGVVSVGLVFGALALFPLYTPFYIMNKMG